MYLERYGPGSAYREAGVELVSFRVRGSMATGSDPSSAAEHEYRRDTKLTSVGVRRVYVADLDEFRDVLCYDFRDLGPGDKIVGPAVIWTPITTVVIDSNQQLMMDEMRNLVIQDLDT
jgi:N-methylhydantoinase A